MNFDEQKKKQLSKSDLSKKGSVDKQIEHLIKRLNEHKDIYTTSSCAGRIVLLKMSESGKKNESVWLIASHDPVNFEHVRDVINEKNLKDAHKIWLKQEAAIFHICTRTPELAEKLLGIAKETGLKRSGAISMGKRIILEMVGTEALDALVAIDSKKVIDDEYLRLIVAEANKKMLSNLEHIDRFYKAIEKL